MDIPREGMSDERDKGTDHAGSGRPGSANRRGVLWRCLVTSSVLAQSMVDAVTLTEHLFDLDSIAESRHQGRYIALCGIEVLAASMTTKERDFCRECISKQVDRCT